MMKQPLSRSINGMTNVNMTNNSMINSIGRIPNMNSSGSNSNSNIHVFTLFTILSY